MKQAVVLCLVIFVGCSSSSKINATMQSWVGHKADELVVSWGPPTSSYDLSDGGKVLLYQYDRKGQKIDGYFYRDNFGNSRYKAPETVNSYTAERQFTVNKDGIITAWRWKGE